MIGLLLMVRLLETKRKDSVVFKIKQAQVNVLLRDIWLLYGVVF